MEITSTTIYLITRLDGIGRLLTWASILAALLFILLICFCADKETIDAKTEKNAVRTCRVFLVASVFLVVLNVLTPTTKEMAAIVVIPKVANSEAVQGLGNGLVDLARQWMAELSPAKANP